VIKPFYLLTDSTGTTSSHTNITIQKQFSSVTYTVVILIWLVDMLGETCNTHFRKLKSTFRFIFPVADLLPVFWYGCEAWSLTLREERTRRLKMFENRLLNRVFGPKRDEVTGEWRKLHNEELNDLYFFPNIVCCCCFPGVTTHCGCIFTAQ
jgi:hypothetical protein